MSNAADIVRAVLTGRLGTHEAVVQAMDALDALVAERDEAVEMSRQMVAAYELAGEETEAAEAEVARLKEFMACADTPLMRDVLAERDRLREQYDEATAHLYGIVEADKQDAMMGHPNPGDSCVSIYIGLVLMEWLDTRASLVATGDPRNRDENPHPDGEEDG